MNVYSRPSCIRCVRVKKVLGSKGIPYMEVNVDIDEDAQERIQPHRTHGLPVIEHEGEFYSGEEAEAYVNGL